LEEVYDAVPRVGRVFAVLARVRVLELESLLLDLVGGGDEVLDATAVVGE
jgi:hypothetical protein